MLTTRAMSATTVEEALRHREKGELPRAVEIMAEVWKDSPGNVEAGYNLGLLLLESGMADSAASVLETVTEHKAIRPTMRRDALYNLGLARAMTARLAQAERPAQARELYAKAVQSFRDALSGAADADFTSDAGYNIEAVWRLLSQLEEQMQQSSSSGMDSLAQQLQDLASRQQDLRQQTQESADPSELSDEQRNLQQRSQDLANQMQQKGQENAADHVQKARDAQAEAARKLSEKAAREATDHQNEALDQLRDALSALLGRDEQPSAADSAAARRAAEELARLQREAQKQRQQREEELRRDPRYRPEPSTTGRIDVEKNW